MNDLDISDEINLEKKSNREMMIPRVVGPYMILKKILETRNCVVLAADLIDSPQDNYKIALKCIPKKNYDEKEVEIISQIHHPNIINFLGSFEYSEKEPHFYVIAMAHAYQDLIGFLEENANNEIPMIVIGRIIYDSLNALKALHKNGICHRDIKPDNILVIDFNEGIPLIAISDFGLSIKADSDQISTEGTGTINYAAPELIHDKFPEKGIHDIEFKEMVNYGYNIDVYSLGIIFYVLLFQEEPFYFEDGTYNYYERLNGIDFELKKKFFPSLAEPLDLMSQMMNPDPQKRLSSKAALNHKWFKTLKIFGTHPPRTDNIYQQVEETSIDMEQTYG